MCRAVFVNIMGLIDFDLENVMRFGFGANFLSAVCDLTVEVLRSEEGTPEHSEAVARLRAGLNTE